MTTYYGGRSGINIRKEHVKVTYLDFTSMYPSIYELMGLWEFVITEKINVAENTEEFQGYIDKFQLSDAKDKAIFKKWLRGISKVEANEDVFPVRARYGGKLAYNIGINFLTAKDGLYFTNADILASKLITGKAPKILKSYRFEPVGIQKDLKPITLFGRGIDPTKVSFVKALIEQRLDVKKLLESDKDNAELRDQEHLLKIIANSIYGINVQIDTMPVGKTKKHPNGKIIKDVYGLRHLKAKVSKNEQQGKAFNPLIATWLTSGARLILAMTEAHLNENKGYYAYCDTDGIFVKPESVKGLQELVKGLNPYDRNLDMFKVEEVKVESKDGLKNKVRLDNVIFFGISAKRYCLYVEDNTTKQINVLKWSSSALGSVISMPRGWERAFWTDIIRYDKGEIDREYVEAKYGKVPVAYQISITSPHILNQFKRHYGVRAFNFMIIGISHRNDPDTGLPIIPMIPYTKDVKSIIYTPFIDKTSGKLYKDNTQFYWKPLSRLFFEYINNKESKYDGDNGVLQRKHLIVDNVNNDVFYIGKESNYIDETETIGLDDENYVEYDDKVMARIMERITKITLDEARRLRIPKRTILDLKRKVREGKTFRVNKDTRKKLLN